MLRHPNRDSAAWLELRGDYYISARLLGLGGRRLA